MVTLDPASATVLFPMLTTPVEIAVAVLGAYTTATLLWILTWINVNRNIVSRLGNTIPISASNSLTERLIGIDPLLVDSLNTHTANPPPPSHLPPDVDPPHPNARGHTTTP
jgi:hypothetical protein